jgi:hypothetical protein
MQSVLKGKYLKSCVPFSMWSLSFIADEMSLFFSKREPNIFGLFYWNREWVVKGSFFLPFMCPVKQMKRSWVRLFLNSCLSTLSWVSVTNVFGMQNSHIIEGWTEELEQHTCTVKARILLMLINSFFLFFPLTLNRILHFSSFSSQIFHTFVILWKCVEWKKIDSGERESWKSFPRHDLHEMMILLEVVSSLVIKSHCHSSFPVSVSRNHFYKMLSNWRGVSFMLMTWHTIKSFDQEKERERLLSFSLDFGSWHSNPSVSYLLKSVTQRRRKKETLRIREPIVSKIDCFILLF